MNRLELQMTARHFLDNLSTGLYANSADSLWELVRNGLVACMPGPDWQPGGGDVEVTLEDNLPLAPKVRSLVVFDRGSGFTKPKLERFRQLGSSMEEIRRGQQGSHSGAAQKCIGRFAALALNQRCANEDPDSGFYILTRTAAQGPVLMIEMIPAELERHQAATTTWLDPTDNTLGRFKGFRGSFSAVIIPNSVLQTPQEIREALQWRLPRKPDQRCRMTVAGKELPAPPLADKLMMSSSDGSIEVWIDRSNNNANGRGLGIWLTDAYTGLPVAAATRLATALPYPFWHQDLTGDIFVPDLLANQDTSRTGLRANFLKGAAWRRVTAYLLSVADRAKELLGRQDEFGRTSFDSHVLDFAKLCNNTWGKPDLLLTGPTMPVAGGGSSGGRHKPGMPGTPGGKPGKSVDGKPPVRQRAVPIRIGADTFYLSKRQLDPRLLAQVDSGNGRVIYLNEAGYKPMPRTASARGEHIMLMICGAVGQAKYPNDPVAVTMFVADIRMELLTRERRKPS